MHATPYYSYEICCTHSLSLHVFHFYYNHHHIHMDLDLRSNGFRLDLDLYFGLDLVCICLEEYSDSGTFCVAVCWIFGFRAFPILYAVLGTICTVFVLDLDCFHVHSFTVSQRYTVLYIL